MANGERQRCKSDRGCRRKHSTQAPRPHHVADHSEEADQEPAEQEAPEQIHLHFECCSIVRALPRAAAADSSLGAPPTGSSLGARACSAACGSMSQLRRKIMAESKLKGLRVAILATDGFEQSELLEPRKALDGAGATTKVVSPAGKKIKGWSQKEWGSEVPVDVPLDSAKAEEFDALLLPGGVMNPDQLRMNPRAVEFVKHFTDT